MSLFLHQAEAALDSSSAAFWEAPSLFWVAHSDFVLGLFAWVGLLAALGVLLGFANAPLMALLWVVYGSFVHVGQTFYGFGWEMLLLEAGVLGIFWPRHGTPLRAT